MTKKKNPKKPLIVKMMLAMVAEYKKIAKPKFEDVRDICLILIMMAAFLRESEAVALKKDDVWIENMEVDGVMRKVLMVYVEKAKNDQERNGHVTMVGGSMSNSELCPVKWFRLYSVTRIRTAEYLFHTVNSGNKMARTTPAGRMKKWVKAIGMCNEPFVTVLTLFLFDSRISHCYDTVNSACLFLVSIVSCYVSLCLSCHSLYVLSLVNLL